MLLPSLDVKATESAAIRSTLAEFPSTSIRTTACRDTAFCAFHTSTWRSKTRNSIESPAKNMRLVDPVASVDPRNRISPVTESSRKIPSRCFAPPLSTNPIAWISVAFPPSVVPKPVYVPSGSGYSQSLLPVELVAETFQDA